mgnify:CR=1 FL=1
MATLIILNIQIAPSSLAGGSRLCSYTANDGVQFSTGLLFYKNYIYYFIKIIYITLLMNEFYLGTCGGMVIR